MSKYQTFCFDNYVFDKANKTLVLRYNFDSQESLEERYVFNCDFVDYNQDALDRALQLLFLMAGISYYKAYLPPKIIAKNLTIDPTVANFLSKTYQKGLGEFFYENSLAFNNSIEFPITATEISPLEIDSDGTLVAVGGGKDSIVSVEKMKGNLDVTTWSLGHRQQLEPLIKQLDTEHIWVERQLDPKLFKLNSQGAYNGHVPISAIFGCVGAILCILTGKKDIVMSNEYSANEETMVYQGYKINHQYSKTSEFEEDFQRILTHLFGNGIRYYSLLRPFSELQISEMFAQYFDKYRDVFSSCNRAFVQRSDALGWCGECPKCVFTFLALATYLDIDQVTALFGGKNLLLNKDLRKSFQKLISSDQRKHFDCVGTIEESRYAMKQLLDQFPESKALFGELHTNYDHATTQPHLIPQDIVSKLDLL